MYNPNPLPIWKISLNFNSFFFFWQPRQSISRFISKKDEFKIHGVQAKGTRRTPESSLRGISIIRIDILKFCLRFTIIRIKIADFRKKSYPINSDRSSWFSEVSLTIRINLNRLDQEKKMLDKIKYSPRGGPAPSLKQIKSPKKSCSGRIKWKKKKPVEAGEPLSIVESIFKKPRGRWWWCVEVENVGMVVSVWPGDGSNLLVSKWNRK